MLFQIIGTEVFVAASMHMRPAGYQLPTYLSEAVSSAEDCIFESDLDNVFVPDFAHFPRGDSLERHVSPALFSATARLWPNNSATNPLSPCKPWWAAIVIACARIIAAGNLLEAGIDRQLWENAKRFGKRRRVLEETTDGLRAFDAASITEQIAGLEFLVADPDRCAATFKRLHAAWCIGDIAVFTDELQTSLQLLPVTFDRLIRSRNEQWIPQIVSAIERLRRALFVVEAMHLAGEHSLQRFLKAQPNNYDLICIQP